MTTLVEHMIVAGADDRPPMLEKSMYDSWQSRMLLYIQCKEHGRMIHDSVLNGPLDWGTIEANGLTRPKTYEELSEKEKLQVDCDLKATNIVLQGLPPDVYYLVSHHKVAKEIWDRVRFASIKGETLYEYYLRFAQLINDMNIIKISMRPVQINTKYLNNLQPEWSKFVTNVKLARDLHTTNYDQLYAYLSQHKAYANEVRVMHKRYPDPLALIANCHHTPSYLNTHHSQYNPPQYQQQLSPLGQQIYSSSPHSRPYEAPHHLQ
ncbi:hypothetical protein Tco_1179101 [Tanacetum coccineum]